MKVMIFKREYIEDVEFLIVRQCLDYNLDDQNLKTGQKVKINGKDYIFSNFIEHNNKKTAWVEIIIENTLS